MAMQEVEMEELDLDLQDHALDDPQLRPIVDALPDTTDSVERNEITARALRTIPNKSAWVLQWLRRYDALRYGVF